MLFLINYFEISIFDLKNKYVFKISSFLFRNRNVVDAKQTHLSNVIYNSGRKSLVFYEM